MASRRNKFMVNRAQKGVIPPPFSKDAQVDCDERCSPNYKRAVTKNTNIAESSSQEHRPNLFEDSDATDCETVEEIGHMQQKLSKTFPLDSSTQQEHTICNEKQLDIVKSVGANTSSTDKDGE